MYAQTIIFCRNIQNQNIRPSWKFEITKKDIGNKIQCKFYASESYNYIKNIKKKKARQI